MNAKEKAKELVDKYYDKLYYYLRYIYNEKEICLAAKQCALIAVYEIIRVLEDLSHFTHAISDELSFYEEVATELEEL